MALNNIFREPRREITESIFGLVVVGGYFWLDYRFALWAAPEDIQSNHIAIFPVMLFGVILTFVLALLVSFAHFVGEEICDALAQRGLDPRPRNRK